MTERDWAIVNAVLNLAFLIIATVGCYLLFEGLTLLRAARADQIRMMQHMGLETNRER